MRLLVSLINPTERYMFASEGLCSGTARDINNVRKILGYHFFIDDPRFFCVLTYIILIKQLFYNFLEQTFFWNFIKKII